MTNKTEDRGTVSYTQFDANLADPSSRVDYVSQTGGNSPRVIKTRVSAYTVVRDGRTYRFPAHTVHEGTPTRKGYARVNDFQKVGRTLHNAEVGGFPPPAASTASSQWYALPSTSLLSGWTSNDDIKIVEKLREKCFGSDFDVGVFLAEGHQALDLIADSASRIFRSVRALKRGFPADALRHLIQGTSRPWRGGVRFQRSDAEKAMSANWLQMQYGLLPLLQDTKAAAEFIAHKLYWPAENKISAGRRSEIYQKTGIYMGYYPGVDASAPYFGRVVSGICKQKKAVSVYFRENESTELAQLVPVDPLTVLHELTAWSFVADWFIPIGQYLSARGSVGLFQGRQIVNSSLVTQIWHPVYWVQSTNGGGPVVDWMATTNIKWNHQALKRSMSYSRTKASTLDVPLPSFKPLSKVASWQHAANTVALLVQRHGSR